MLPQVAELMPGLSLPLIKYSLHKTDIQHIKAYTLTPEQGQVLHLLRCFYLCHICEQVLVEHNVSKGTANKLQLLRASGW